MNFDIITIIVCARSDIQKLRNNIEQTIGVPHKLFVIDNSQNRYSIFEAYNLGLRNNQNEICCFVHDDVIFNSSGWGKVIINTFKREEKLGLLGIVGSSIKTSMPSGYFNCPTKYKHYNIIQGYKYSNHTNKNQENLKSVKIGFNRNEIEPVAIIDGVFFALKNNGKLCFDSNLKGFHGYDFNISMECHKYELKVSVINTIDLTHLSEGILNANWYLNTHLLHRKYKKLLPIGRTKDNSAEFDQLESKNGYNFIKHGLTNGLRTELITWYFKLLTFERSLKIHQNIFKHLLKSYLKRVD